jgi:hypothetical protein
MQPRQPRYFGIAAAPDEINLTMNFARLLRVTPTGRDEAAQLCRHVV